MGNQPAAYRTGDFDKRNPPFPGEPGDRQRQQQKEPGAFEGHAALPDGLSADLVRKIMIDNPYATYGRLRQTATAA